MTSSVNQVAAGKSHTDSLDELIRTLRNEIVNLKSSNNWRKDLVERGLQQ